MKLSLKLSMKSTIIITVINNMGMCSAYVPLEVEYKDEIYLRHSAYPNGGRDNSVNSTSA